MPYFGNYDSPNDVLLDEHLSTDKKIQTLERWREDKEALGRASGEGMAGDDRAHVLKAIENALASLKG